MMTLYLKELRGLLPLLILMAVVFGSDFYMQPLAERLDEFSWEEQSGRLNASDGRLYAWVLIIFPLIAAYSVFPREHDEGTIEFLYALPIGRRGIFFAKAAAAWTILLIGVALDQAAGALLQALNPQSFSGEQWSLKVAVGVALIDAFFLGIILSHGLLISFLRRFGLLVYGFLLVLVVRIKKLVAGYDAIDPTELLALEFRASELVIPWSGLLLHAVGALGAGALAYILWMGHGGQFTRLHNRLQTHLAGRVALGCVTLLFVISGLIWAVITAVEEEAEIEVEPVQYRTFFPVRAETLHYDFTYPSNASERARTLMRDADGIYDEVAAALGVEAGPRIDADLTDSGDGHLGIASGGVIRVALESITEEEARVTLAHETTHAFQSALAERRLTESWSSLRSLIEGSAVFVAAQIRPDATSQRVHRRIAAAAYERHQLRLEDLIDNEVLTAAHHSNFVYILGETWTAALVESCGPAIVGDFFRSLSRDDAPEDLEGIALWQDTLSAAGCALEPAVSAWGSMMKRLAREERQFLEELPRLGGGVVRVEDGEVLFQVKLDREVVEPAEAYYLRIRESAGTPEDEIYTFTSELEEDGSGAFFWVPEGWFESRTFELQFGQAIPGALWPFFEGWQAASR